MADAGTKRKAADGGEIVVKKQKTDLIAAGPPRTSGLAAPTMLLTGHQGEVYTAQFNHKGTLLASGAFDAKILIWSVYGDCENLCALEGHKNAVQQLQWASDSRTIFSASADKTAQLFDVEDGTCVRRYRDHSSFVNSCAIAADAENVLATGADDSCVKLWDPRQRRARATIRRHAPVTAVALSRQGDHIYVGGLENTIQVVDAKTLETVFELEGHTDTVTSLQPSRDGKLLLSNAMDCTLRAWNVQPYAAGSREEAVFVGHKHNFEKTLIKCGWSPDSSRVCVGSSDRNVYIFDYATQRPLYVLPGHKGCVNEVAFHPSEPVVLSAGSDKRLFLGELPK